MTWQRIPVRIRLDDEDHSHPLGDCTIDDLPTLPSVVKLWGYQGQLIEVSAQFTADGFEIVVHTSAE